MNGESSTPCSIEVPVADPIPEQAESLVRGSDLLHGHSAILSRARRARDLRSALLEVYRRLDEHHVGMFSGGVAFFGLLSLFPGFVALISLYGLVSDPVDVANQIRALSKALPWSARALLAEQLNRLVRTSETGLSISLVVSTLLLVLGASGGAHAVMEGINAAYADRQNHSYLRRRWRALLFTFVFLISTLSAVGFVTILPRALIALGLGGPVNTLVGILRWPTLGCYVGLGLSVLYRYAPHHRRPRWSDAFPGALMATGIWLFASLLLSVYVNLFGKLSAVYGALAGVIVLLLWFYVSSYAVLLGAQLNSVLEKQSVSDLSISE